jgi:nucleotide-binding universal stress UspA family protein
MRVLIAHDLAAEADRALDVVGRAAWPAGTVVRIVTSPVGIGDGVSSFAGPRARRTHARQVAAAVAARHALIAGTLAASGVRVETAIVPGAPGQAVVQDAETFDADLVVTGARVQSPLSAAVLGSVSTEIAERAPCSVLVVRVESLARVLVATDGSPSGAAAETVAAAWPMFQTAMLRVLTVVASPSAYDGLIPFQAPQNAASGEDAGSRLQAEQTIRETVEHLARSGRLADGRVRVGDAAEQIVAAAREWPADVVVLGATGRSLVRRFVIGSVARALLDRASCSVLVVRPKASDPAGSDPAGPDSVATDSIRADPAQPA